MDWIAIVVGMPRYCQLVHTPGGIRCKYMYTYTHTNTHTQPKRERDGNFKAKKLSYVKDVANRWRRLFAAFAARLSLLNISGNTFECVK